MICYARSFLQFTQKRLFQLLRIHCSWGRDVEKDIRNTVTADWLKYFRSPALSFNTYRLNDKFYSPGMLYGSEC